MSSSSPTKVVLRAYQVGFGDCFLLTFVYDPPEEDRHVLVDFGSTAIPDGAPTRTDMLRQIAEDIRKKCDKKLYAVIATHRHADHINGFSTKDGKASGDIIRSCKPELVLQPWTEDEKALEDPLARSFLDRLDTLHSFSLAVEQDLPRLRGIRGCNTHVLKGLEVLAANNTGRKDPSNLSAVENLRTMGRPVYLYYGQPAELELPGVQVHVLGPPTLQQSKEILRQRRTHPDEFWQLLCASDPMVRDSAPLFEASAAPVDQWAPQHARWLIRRLTSLRSEQLLEMVRILDDYLNNTSLILLLEVGGRKLLFPGDAQWENWSYALQHPDPAERKKNGLLLRGASLYKVGHHGSRNATPRSLWKLIQGNGLLSVVSTKPDRHGSAEDHTEVPRATLVKELQRFRFFSTQEMGWRCSPNGEPPSREFEIELDPPAGETTTSAARPS